MGNSKKTYYDGLQPVRWFTQHYPNRTESTEIYSLHSGSPYVVKTSTLNNGLVVTNEHGKNNDVEVLITNQSYPNLKLYSDTLFYDDRHPEGVGPGLIGYARLKQKFESKPNEPDYSNLKNSLIFPNTFLKFITKNK